MRRLSLSTLALAVLAGRLMAVPLPPGVDHAELSQVLGEDLSRERLQSLWDSSAFHYRVARALARAKVHAKAAWHLGETVRLDPEHGEAHFALGKMLWRFGEQDRAKDHWVKALDCDRPEPRAKAALAKLAPELAQEPAAVRDMATFLQIARITADFRRLGEIQEAVLSYSRGAGLPMVLTEADWREQLAKLHEFGLLQRPGGLPSGEGMVLSNQQGLVRSSTHGSPAAPRDLPDAMTRPRGYRVDPKVLEQALASDRPEAVELTLALMDSKQLERSWEKLAAIASLKSWPGALDQLLYRLEKRPPDVLPSALSGILRGLVGAEGVEPGHRWGARGHLHRAGARDLPRLPEEELLPLLGKAFNRPTLLEAAHSALTALGAGAEEPLLALVRRKESSSAMGSALALLPRYGTRRAVVPLVELIELGRARGYPPSGEIQVIEVMKTITGADHGRDMEAWRQEASETVD